MPRPGHLRSGGQSRRSFRKNVFSNAHLHPGPAAVHLEWKKTLNPDGTFKSAEELDAQYSALGVTPDKEVIPYCQGGYRSANTYAGCT